MNKNQKGFSVVILLLSIVALGLAAFDGWLVYDKYIKEDTKEVASVSDEKKEDATTKESETTEATKQSYMEITQWGIKIPINTITEKAYYTYDETNQTAMLHVDFDGDTEKECSSEALIAKVTDYSEDSDNWRQKTSELEKAGIKIGDAYYYIDGSQSACSDNSAIQAKATAVRSYWLEQAKKLTKI